MKQPGFPSGPQCTFGMTQYDGEMAVTWAELVAAIRNAPEDVALRQVAIDWLLARGDPHGEYLSLHQALESAPVGTRQAAELAARLDAFEGDRVWAERLSRLGVKTDGPRRGWLDEAWLTGPDAANAGELFELEPVLHLGLVNPAREASVTLASSAALARLHSLMLDNDPDVPWLDGFAPLLASPHLGRLKALHVVGPFDANEEAAALMRSPARPTRMALTVNGHLGEAFACSDAISQVTDLRLSGFGVDSALYGLARGRLGPLRSLKASSAFGSSLEGSLSVLDTRLDALETLWVTRPSDAFLEQLTERELGRLTDLFLIAPHFSLHALIPFAPKLERLRALRVSHLEPDRFGESQLSVLAGHLSERIEALEFTVTGDLDLSHLLSSRRLTGLKRLTLSRVRFDEGVLKAIAGLAASGTLRELLIGADLPQPAGANLSAIQVTRIDAAPERPEGLVRRLAFRTEPT